MRLPGSWGVGLTRSRGRRKTKSTAELAVWVGLSNVNRQTEGHSRHCLIRASFFFSCSRQQVLLLKRLWRPSCNANCGLPNLQEKKKGLDGLSVVFVGLGSYKNPVDGPREPEPASRDPDKRMDKEGENKMIFGHGEGNESSEIIHATHKRNKPKSCVSAMRRLSCVVEPTLSPVLFICCWFSIINQSW